MLRRVWESCCRAWIRFWDNSFIKDDQVLFLRNEIDYLRNVNERLQSQMIELMSPTKTVETSTNESIDYKPIGTAYESQSAKRARLERESYNKANLLATEASKALGRKSKTVEELEIEADILE